jgi:hypothetical protein
VHIFLTTERLVLRRFTEADADNLEEQFLQDNSNIRASSGSKRHKNTTDVIASEAHLDYVPESTSACNHRRCVLHRNTVRPSSGPAP